MAKLEKYVWTNTWLDEPENAGKRVLLIGDSITRGYQPYVKKALNTVYVDMYTTARALDDPCYEKELFYSASLLNYDVIHFNNGLHGFHLSAEEYGRLYDKIISALSGLSHVIIASSTPITAIDNPKVYDELNKTVIERNEKALNLAVKLGLERDDLYAATAGNNTIRLNDGYHYTDDGYKYLADCVANNIKKSLAAIDRGDSV